MTNASQMMSVLAEPIRQAIFDRLADGPRPVGELAAELPISRPAVSQHLKVLKDVGLVIDRKAGTLPAVGAIGIPRDICIAI